MIYTLLTVHTLCSIHNIHLRKGVFKHWMWPSKVKNLCTLWKIIIVPRFAETFLYYPKKSFWLRHGVSLKCLFRRILLCFACKHTHAHARRPHTRRTFKTIPFKHINSPRLVNTIVFIDIIVKQQEPNRQYVVFKQSLGYYDLYNMYHIIFYECGVMMLLGTLPCSLHLQEWFSASGRRVRILYIRSWNYFCVPMQIIRVYVHTFKRINHLPTLL